MADKETTKTAAASKTAADKVAADNAAEVAAKETADQEAEAAAEAERQRLAEIPTVEDAAKTSPSDVVNANENPTFSKAENNSDADAPRVQQIGPSGQWGKSVQTPDAELAAREQRLAAKEKELADREAKLTEQEAEVAAKVKTPGLKVKFEGVEYQFAENAPKSIRIDGKVLTQKEIAADEEILLQLIGGGSSLIKKH